MSSPPTVPPLSERDYYPALLPREIEILKAWLKDHEREYERFEFNVRAGQGIDPGPSYSDADRAQFKLNTKKRIDAVAYRGNSVTIIEVKDRAGTTALGEILSYETLYALDHGGTPIRLLLVTNVLQADMAIVFAQFGVPVSIVNV